MAKRGEIWIVDLGMAAKVSLAHLDRPLGALTADEWAKVEAKLRERLQLTSG